MALDRARAVNTAPCIAFPSILEEQLNGVNTSDPKRYTVLAFGSLPSEFHLGVSPFLTSPHVLQEEQSADHGGRGRAPTSL